MKSFSHRGIANKAFFGPDIPTFGTPYLTTFVPPFIPKGGTDFSADIGMVGVSIASASTAIAIAANAAGITIGSTTDGGETWTRTAGAMPNFTNALQSASKAPTTFVIVGLDNTFAGQIWTSHDSINWTNRTPVGARPAGVYYSSLAGVFIVFDQAQAQVYTSPDGDTWTTTPLADTINTNLISENNLTLVMQGVQSLDPTVSIWTSPDGQAWTQRYISPSMTSPQAIRWIGTEFAAGQNDFGSGIQQMLTSGNGTLWNIASQASNFNTAPFTNSIEPFGNTFYCGYDFDTSKVIAIAINGGIAFTTVNALITSDYGGIGLRARSDGLYIYDFGTGAIATADGANWGIALLDNAVVQDMASVSGLTLAVGTDFNGIPQIWKTEV